MVLRLEDGQEGSVFLSRVLGSNSLLVCLDVPVIKFVIISLGLYFLFDDSWSENR
jgi:hypothetical protein